MISLLFLVTIRILNLFLNLIPDTLAPNSKAPEVAKQDRPENGPMKKFVLSTGVAKAELRWALQTIATHTSYRSAGANASLFKVMFPDSEIASKMELGRTKVGYLITHGLAPFFMDELMKTLDGCDDIVVGFDESLNKISQHQQMDVCVRFWDADKDKVASRYLGSAFLSSSTAQDLLRGLKECLQQKSKIISKITQVSMDGPHVNWKLVKDLNKELRELRSNPQFSLMDIGSCGLHSVHNAFKAGMRKTEWELDTFFYSLWNLFKDVPLRRSEYTGCTKSEIFPLKFCGTRWVENKKVAERAAKMMPSLKVYVSAVRDQIDTKMKATNPGFRRSFVSVASSKAFAVVQKYVNDPLVESKLAFFTCAADSVEPFLRTFQSEQPLAPFLHGDLTSLLRGAVDKIFKETYLDEIRSIMEVKFEETNLRAAHNVDVGFATNVALKVAGKKLQEQKTVNFKRDCRSYYVGMLEKMFQRSPLKHSLTKYITCLNPELVHTSPETSTKLMKRCLEVMVEGEIISGTEADRVFDEFRKLITNAAAREKLANFSRSKVRLDEFWMALLSNSEQENQHLRCFVKKILILAHGNALLERGFSINDECLVENLLEESLVAQRVVYDAIHAAGGSANVNITASMLQYAKSAHSVYCRSLEDKKNETTQAEQEKQRKRVADTAIKELEAKKKKIQADAKLEIEAIEKEVRELRS